MFQTPPFLPPQIFGNLLVFRFAFSKRVALFLETEMHNPNSKFHMNKNAQDGAKNKLFVRCMSLQRLYKTPKQRIGVTQKTVIIQERPTPFAPFCR
jgi:hypothetical protein